MARSLMLLYFAKYVHRLRYHERVKKEIIITGSNKRRLHAHRQEAAATLDAPLER